MEHTNTTIVLPVPESGPLTAGDIALWVVRYGLGGLMILGGLVLLLVSPSGNGADGLVMAAGGGLSVLLLNFLFRLGVSGDEERERHEQAWRHFEEHGEWPEEAASGRTWTVPAGAVMLSSELDRVTVE